jgi:hypothetical protein
MQRVLRSMIAGLEATEVQRKVSLELVGAGYVRGLERKIEGATYVLHAWVFSTHIHKSWYQCHIVLRDGGLESKVCACAAGYVPAVPAARPSPAGIGAHTPSYRPLPSLRVYRQRKPCVHVLAVLEAEHLLQRGRRPEPGYIRRTLVRRRAHDTNAEHSDDSDFDRPMDVVSVYVPYETLLAETVVPVKGAGGEVGPALKPLYPGLTGMTFLKIPKAGDPIPQSRDTRRKNSRPRKATKAQANAERSPGRGGRGGRKDVRADAGRQSRAALASRGSGKRPPTVVMASVGTNDTGDDSKMGAVDDSKCRGCGGDHATDEQARGRAGTWVCCDRCDGWWWPACDPDGLAELDYSENYYCVNCRSVEDE